MNRIKKLCFFSLISFASTAHAVYGDYEEFSPVSYHDSYEYEPSGESMESSYRESSCRDSYAYGSDGDFNGYDGDFNGYQDSYSMPYSMCCDQPKRAIYAIGEFLFWRPDQPGMTYGLSISEEVTPLGEKNRALQQTSKWAAGFRAGAGLQLNDIPCDVEVTWTRYHQTFHTCSSDPLILATQLINPPSPFVFGGADVGGKPESSWNIKFDVWEVNAAYRYNVCNFLLRPYLGVATIRLDQHQKIKYNDFFDSNISDFVDAKVRQKNNFWGIGPKIGLSSRYTIAQGLGVTSELAGSFFYGHGNNPVKTFIFDDRAPLPEFEVRYKQHRVVPLAQAKIGVFWNHCLMQTWFVDLAVQYEVQYLWGTWRNQSSPIQNIQVADAGFSNLMLQGLTVSLRGGF